MAESGTDLDELGELIRRYVELSGGDPELSGTQQAALQLVASALDRQYWRVVAAVVPDPERLSGSQLHFGDDERLLVDAGLLNRAILAKAADALRAQVLSDLSRAGAPNHFYFSEFLSHRQKLWAAERSLGRNAGEDPAPGVAADAELRRLGGLQAQTFKALSPLFHDLPGVSANLAAQVSSGRVKALIDAQGLCGSPADPGAALAVRGSLEALLAGVLAAVKARAQEAAHLDLLDALSALAVSMSARMDHIREQPSDQATLQSEDKAVSPDTLSGEDRGAFRDFLYSEIHLLKSRIDLRCLRAGSRRTHSVLTDDAERLTKPDVSRIMRTIGEYDRLPLQHLNLAILPFKGDGFFDWDRSCLVIPMSPGAGKEQAICMAVADYRVLIDASQDGGSLKRSYEAALAGRDFAEDFPGDYCSWISKLGSGWRGALSGPAYEFFKHRVGPAADGVIGPADLLHFTPAECQGFRAAVRQRLDSGDARFEDCYHLAVVSWRLNDLETAQQAMTRAVELRSSDRRALFSLALIQRQANQRDAARETLERVVSTASNTLWQVYASDLLSAS